jgi:hypothetical protein
MEISTFWTPATASEAVPHRPGARQPAFQLVVVYDAFATGKVTVELGFVLS